MRRGVKWSNSQLCENWSSKRFCFSCWACLSSLASLASDLPLGAGRRAATEMSTCRTRSSVEERSSGEVDVISMSLYFSKFKACRQMDNACIQSFYICRTEDGPAVTIDRDQMMRRREMTQLKMLQGEAGAGKRNDGATGVWREDSRRRREFLRRFLLDFSMDLSRDFSWMAGRWHL